MAKKDTTTFSITKLNITTLSIMGLFATLCINDIQHNAFSVILLSAVMMSVVITLMFMLSVVMLNVVMLSVVAPKMKCC
jgi:hypothetical protein